MKPTMIWAKKKYPDMHILSPTAPETLRDPEGGGWGGGAASVEAKRTQWKSEDYPWPYKQN